MNFRSIGAALTLFAVAATSGTAQPRRAPTPLDLRTNTDYPTQGQPVTLTSYWVGLRPPYTPRYQLRYQVSRTNPPTWIDMPGYTCTAEPCQYSINSPAAAEFQSRPQGVVILVRAVIRDTQTGTDSPAQAIKTVTWLPDPNANVTGPYSLSLTINGLGCTITPRAGDTSYQNSNCVMRGPLDRHDPRVPVVRLTPDGRGRFDSAPFTIVATWSPLPPGTWSVRIARGSTVLKTCTTSPCSVTVNSQKFDGDFIGRDNANASLGWQEGTRENPSVQRMPSSLGAEIGIDFMRN